MIDTGIPLTDPSGAGSLVAAATWVRSLITGTTATIVATIAVAGLGFLLLQGRLPLRRGIGVVLGCFVIFGASVIADGLLALRYGVAEVQAPSPMVATTPPVIPGPPPQPQVYDPYAGASVPVR